jgi:pyruvate formate lyase activating enzyme
MCTIKKDKRGFCRTKENRNGKLMSLTYGQISALAVDPIEKKPLAHFYPGSRSLSISSVGCSFTCPWCQNYHLSTGNIDHQKTKFMHPEEVVEAAMVQECTSISYTYNEPLINLNFVEDTARFAHDSEIKNVLVTNGYVSISALKNVVDVIDAANVDWKSFNQEFYRKYCSAELDAVLEATEFMKKHGVHVEVTFLIIPETNDNMDEMRKMAFYLVDHLGSETPLHLSRFFPMYKFQHIPPTPVDILVKSRNIAMEAGVNYVYIGNIRGGGYEDTICPNCTKPVIERRGYNISSWNLSNNLKCSYCGNKIPIVGQREMHKNSYI